MFDVEKSAHYIAAAEKFGLDTRDPGAVHDLIQIIRLMDLKLSRPNKIGWHDETMAEELGISLKMVRRLKNTQTWQVATQIVLAEFLTDEARQDARAKMFGLYQELFTVALEQNLRIAAGRVINKDTGKELPYAEQPEFRDQATAFRNIVENPVAQAWLQNAFLGDVGPQDEEAHLALRDSLRQNAVKLQLDSPDGVEVTVPAEASSAAPLAIE